MAGDHIDEAYVDIKPDASGFGREVNAELTPALHQIEGKLDDLIDTIEKAFDRLIIHMEAAFEGVASSVDDSLDDIRHDVRRTADAIAFDFEAGTNIAKHAVDDLADSADHDFDRIKRKSRKSGDETGRGFLGGIVNAISTAGTNINGTISSAFGNIGSVFGGDWVSNLVKIAGFVLIIPSIIAVGAALSQLLGLLALIPAAIGIVVAAVAPLIIAFHGISDAVSAGLSGDTAKFNEALKGLAPSARTVVKEIVKLKSQFDSIKNSVQQAFFAPLVGTFKQLGTTLLPALNSGLTTVASSLGRFVAGLLKLLSTPSVIKTINALFTTTGQVIDAFALPAQALFDAFFTTLKAGLPFVAQMFSLFAKGIQIFANWADAATQGKQFTNWVQNAFRVVGELWDLLKMGGQLIATIFGGPGIKESGESLIQSLTKMIAKFDAFFKSAKGIETLKAMALEVKAIGKVLVWLAEVIVWTVEALNTFSHWLVDVWTWLKKIPGVVVAVWNSITGFFSALGSGIAGAATAFVHWLAIIPNSIVAAWHAITGFFSAIGSGIAGAATAFATWIMNLVTWLGQLPGKILGAMVAFPGMLVGFFFNTLNHVAYTIGFIVGSWIRIFLNLPGQIWAVLSAIPGVVASIFTTMWNLGKSIVVSGVTFVVAYIASLPGRAWSALSALYGVAVSVFTSMWNVAKNIVISGIDAVVSFVRGVPGKTHSAIAGIVSVIVNVFTDAWNGAKRKVSEGINGAVAIAKQLPGRIKGALGDAGSWLYGIGQDIVRGLGRGITSMLGWVSDKARSIAGSALKGAKDALGIGSPSKEFAKLGVWSARGFDGGFSKEMPDAATNIAQAIKMPVDMFKQQARSASYARTAAAASDSNMNFTAYLKINDDQLHPVVVTAITQNPQAVALAAENGESRLARRR